MPILFKDQLIGKVDAAAHRDGGVLAVHAVHQDVAFTPAMFEAVDAELESLATWLGMDRVSRTD